MWTATGQIETMSVEILDRLIQAGIGGSAIVLGIVIVVAGIIALVLNGRRDRRDEKVTNALLQQNAQQAKALDEYRGQGESIKTLATAMVQSVDDNRKQIDLLQQMNTRAEAAAAATSQGFQAVDLKLDATASRMSESVQRTATALAELRSHITATGDANTSAILARLTEALAPLDRLEEQSRQNTELVARRHEALINVVTTAKADIITAFQRVIENPSRELE